MQQDKTTTESKPVLNEPASTNIHVLPVSRKKKTHRSTGPHESNDVVEESNHQFKELGEKLEQRIEKIELDFKKSIEHFEHEIHKAIKDANLQSESHQVTHEIKTLSSQLEDRVQKTLKLLSHKEETSFQEKKRMELIKRLTSQLVRIFSFDFYRGVLKRLGSDEFSQEVDPFGMDHQLIEKVKPFFDFLYYKYWRVTTTGIENIPNQGRALIVGNHSGTVPYDGSMIKASILNEHPQRKDARFLVEDFVYHMPFMGTLMYRIGGVRACPENAEYLLNAEHLVIVFPEGVKGIGKYYKNRYKLQRFGRGGFIKLCMKTRSPLIPVGVMGAEEIHPIILKSNVLAKTIGLPYIPITPTFPWLGLFGCIPLPTKWAIHFGKPIYFDKYTKDDLKDDLLIHKLSEKVRLDIQEIIFNLLRKRRSVWVG